MPALSLAPHVRRSFDRLAQDLVRVLGARFVALVASGPQSSVAFAASIQPSDLEALSALTGTWTHDGLDTPLLITPDEFRRSLDAFPLEYQAIIDRHVVIAGQPPFDDLVVEPSHLRRACEVQAKSHLIHLRQGWIDAAGHDEDLAGVIVRSAGPLHALLSNVARLGGAHGHDDLALAGAKLAGLDESLVRDVLAVEAAPDRAHHLVRRLPDYLAATERLWSFVDAWTV
ncbi:MAG TPA: hypothetical protein VHB78_03490 [Vicinamibacterales bacterium]|jgi:hypothetical protein|nr:hypothetical protein [Vicinamibacterales bacterium]